MLDGGRLSECDDARAAKFRGQVIGAVTMTVRKGVPPPNGLHVETVSPQGRGVSALYDGTPPIPRDGVNDVYCEWIEVDCGDFQQTGTRTTGVAGIVKTHMGYGPGEGLDVDED